MQKALFGPWADKSRFISIYFCDVLWLSRSSVAIPAMWLQSRPICIGNCLMFVSTKVNNYYQFFFFLLDKGSLWIFTWYTISTCFLIPHGMISDIFFPFPFFLCNYHFLWFDISMEIQKWHNIRYCFSLQYKGYEEWFISLMALVYIQALFHLYMMTLLSYLLRQIVPAPPQ